MVAVFDLLVREDWELARGAIVDLPQLDAQRSKVEGEFGISLNDLEAIFSLPFLPLERLKRHLLDVALGHLDAIRDELYREVCVKLGYCHAKRTTAWRMAEYIAGVIDVIHTMGALSLAILAIKREVLDRLCGCRGA